MRMRKLGDGQSIVLCIPDEVERKIRTAVYLHDGKPIDSSHVLQWAISETQADLSKNLPLWAEQGERSARQQKIRTRCRGEQGFRKNQQEAEEFSEPEAETLESRYIPSTSIGEDTRMSQWDRADPAVSQIIERVKHTAFIYTWGLPCGKSRRGSYRLRKNMSDKSNGGNQQIQRIIISTRT
jgi:hypothetical protein